MSSKTRASVCIIEFINLLQEDSRKEGEIISRTLHMSNKKSQYVYIRSRRELECLAKEFGQSAFRYLHISCHGNKAGFWTTLDFIPSKEMAALLAPHLGGRRLFISSCLATNNSFARSLLEESECLSILGPRGTINFDDAAIFWSSFYHLMFKTNPDAMHSPEIESNVAKCAALIGNKFRFFKKRDREIIEIQIPESQSSGNRNKRSPECA